MELGLGVYEETEVETDFNEVGLEPLITSTTSVVVEDAAVHDDATGAAVQSWSQSYPAAPPASYPDPTAFPASGSAPPAATTSAGIEQAGKLFLGGISWQTDENQLTSYFSSFGELIDVAVMRNKVTGMSRGFGFITFRSAESVEAVLSRDHHLDGRRIDIKQAVPRDRAPPAVERTQRLPASMYGPSGGGGGHQSNPQYQQQPAPWPPQQQQQHQHQQQHDPLGGSGGGGYRGGVGNAPQHGNEMGTRKLFVGGIPPTVTESEFRQYFERFGAVVDAVVMYDRNTLRSRGFGFVTYRTIGSAHDVLATSHELQGKFVEVKEAEPKEVMNMHGGSHRQNHHQQHHHQQHANYQQQQQQQYAADQYHLMQQQQQQHQHFAAQQGNGVVAGGGGGGPYGNPMDPGNVQLGPDTVYHDARTGLPLSNQQRSPYGAPQQLGAAGYHDPYQHGAYQQQQYGQQQQPQAIGSGGGGVPPSDLGALAEQQYVTAGVRGVVDGYDASQQAGLADAYAGYQQPQSLGGDPQQQQQYTYGHSQEGFGDGGGGGYRGGQGVPPRNHDNRSYRPYNG